MATVEERNILHRHNDDEGAKRILAKKLNDLLVDYIAGVFEDNHGDRIPVYNNKGNLVRSAKVPIGLKKGTNLAASTLHNLASTLRTKYDPPIELFTEELTHAKLQQWRRSRGDAAVSNAGGEDYDDDSSSEDDDDEQPSKRQRSGFLGGLGGFFSQHL